MANIFMHFEPVAPLSDPNPVFKSDFPPYIIPGSPEESNWRMQNPSGWYAHQTKRITMGTTEAHQAVGYGDVSHLTNVLNQHPSYVNVHDEEFGWTPLHEAVRARRLDLIRVLIDHGADINATTKSGESVLQLAYYYVKTNDPEYQSNPDRHPMIQYLYELGASRLPVVVPAQGRDEEL